MPTWGTAGRLQQLIVQLDRADVMSCVVELALLMLIEGSGFWDHNFVGSGPIPSSFLKDVQNHTRQMSFAGEKPTFWSLSEKSL